MKIKLFLLHCALISISHGWKLSPKSISNDINKPVDFNYNEESTPIPEPEINANQYDDYLASNYDDNDVETTGLPSVDYTESDNILTESDKGEFDYATTPFPSISSDYDISLEDAETRVAEASQDIIRLERLVFIMQSSPDGILRTNGLSESDVEFLQQQDISNYEELSMRAESEVENSMDSIESLQDRVDDVTSNLKQDIELDEQDSDNRRDLLLKYKALASKLEDSFNRVQVLADTKDSLEAESIDSNDPAVNLFPSTNNLFPDHESKLKNGNTDLGNEEDVVEDDKDMPDVNLSQIYSQYAYGNSEDNSTEYYNYDDENFNENDILRLLSEENITTEDYPIDLFNYKNSSTSRNSTENNEKNASNFGDFLNLVYNSGLPLDTNQNLSETSNDTTGDNPDDHYTFNLSDNKKIINDSNEEYNTENPTYNYEDEEYNTKNPTYYYEDEEYGSKNEENTDDKPKDDLTDNDLLDIFSNTKDSDQHEGVTNPPAPFEFQGQEINEDFESKFLEILPNYFDSEESNPETNENAFNLITDISENTSPAEEDLNKEPETYEFDPNIDNTLVNGIEENIDENPLLTNEESSNDVSTETSLEDLDKNQSDLNVEGNDIITNSEDNGIFNGQSAQVQLSFTDFLAKMNSSLNEKEEVEAEQEKFLKEIIKNENEEKGVDLEENESNPILKARGLSVVQLALIISAAAIPMLLVIALLVVMSMRRWNKKKVPYKVMDDDEVFDKKILPSESGNDQYSINV